MPKKAGVVNLNTPTSGFKRLMRFNRHYVSKSDGGLIIHFGFIDNQWISQDIYSCHISDADVANNRDRILKYIDTIGYTGVASSTDWRPPADGGNIYPVRFINAARSGDMAEILLYSFTITQTVARAPASEKADKDILADPVACLSSNLEQHVAILTSIFVNS